MKSRIATILTMVLLVAGTGGAIALGTSGSSSSSQGGAASGQYKPGKGCGDKNHTHAKNGQCKKKPKHNCGKKHNQLCPKKPKKCFYKVHGHRRSYQCPATTKKSTKKGKTNHKSTTKPKSTKKSTSKKSGSTRQCTIRHIHGQTVLFCSS